MKLLFCLIIGYYIFSNILIYTFANKTNITSVNNLDYLVVLGAKVNMNKTPSTALQNRLNKVVEYKESITTPIIVSGGQGEDEPQTEASFMKTYLINKGIDPRLIIEEDKSTSTYENLQNTKALMKNKADNILIITTDFHVLRVNLLAKRLNLNYQVIGVKSKLNISTLLREPLALIKSFIFDK
ncbi:MAG: YdcF family protein [Mycoplasmatales bacterium]